ncbi:MAG: DUF3604 domain-containing protein [Gammaproteobacteria bacterium]|nr:DUF3604 domain-containing protein [Gammaproteobacteria bacterium]NNL46393.1 DUF3604 domain-containing protein [Woeseiaceae bacterium]
MSRKRSNAGCLLAGAVLALAGCGPDRADRPAVDSSSGPVESRLVAYTEEREPCANYTPQRVALFGDLHVHTAYSFDAAANSLETYPDDAHRFAKGEAIPFFPVDENGRPLGTAQLSRPLDFVSITDHGEFLGERALCRTQGSPRYDSKFCVAYRNTERQGMLMLGTILDMENPQRLEELCGDDDALCREYARRPWQEMIAAAENAYDRSATCAFTSLIGYEYTGTPGLSNIHRNVIFRNNNVPELPVSYIEAPTDQRLWQLLEPQCNDSNNCSFITIPHNSNLANGRMFSLLQGGKHSDAHDEDHDHGNTPADHTRHRATDDEQRRHALARQQNEPVMEIFQHKGNSECINGLSSIFGAPDEHCEFEQVRQFGETNQVVELRIEDSQLKTIMSEVLTDECGDDTGRGGMVGGGCVAETDFMRSNLLRGLRDEQRLGVNSAKLGVIGSTDTHTSTPGGVSETNWGGHVSGEATPAERLQPGLLTSGIDGNPGGLAGVWAVENSRDAIFDALERREVFGTSGPRIKPRLFAGWGYDADICNAPDMIEQAFANGVAMGADMGARADDSSPVLIAYAEADSAPDATPLQQLQIIKGWVDDEGKAYYKIFTVAGTPDKGAGMDSAADARLDQGHSRLCGVFKDPEFDPTHSAYYYLRALENPSPRWSFYDCMRIPEEQRPEVCDDTSDVAKVIQEMAWTSPIWYRPGPN